MPVILFLIDAFAQMRRLNRAGHLIRTELEGTDL